MEQEASKTEDIVDVAPPIELGYIKGICDGFLAEDDEELV